MEHVSIKNVATPCQFWLMIFTHSLPVYSGQQVRVLGENYTLEDEEDSKIGQVSDCVLVNFFGQFVVFVCWYPHMYIYM